MESSPQLIKKNHRNKKLDKNSAINQLVSIIENSEEVQARIDSINALAQINANIDSVFKLLENLLISDTHEIIRYTAAIVIEKVFLDIALEPLKWVFEHEVSLRCLLAVTKILGKIDSVQSKSLLINRINKISDEKIAESLKTLFENRPIESFSSYELSKIVENYFVITELEKKFGQISYQVKNGLIFQLDLSDVSSHVFGWTILNKFPEFLDYLSSLDKLDLKFNRLTMIPDTIGNLPSIAYLDLSFNKIKSLLNSIGSLKDLKYLNLRYNKLKNLPISSGSLYSLTHLDLRANQLLSLPSTIKNLSELEHLDLHGNNLSKLDVFFKGMSSLKQLD